MRGRTPDIIALLLKSPMTARQILAASAGFKRPYRSLSVARSDLVELLRRGWIRRRPLPSFGAGQSEYLYFPSRRARAVVPEVADLPPRSAAFEPPEANFGHAAALGELVALMERSAALSSGRVRLLDSRGDGQLTASAAIGPGEPRLLRPDYTLLAEIDGAPQLLFVELQHRAALIRPRSPQSVARSFEAKLARYKGLLAGFRRHPDLRRMIEASGGRPLPGFRVLIVTTRGERGMRSLVASAAAYRSLFYFATLERLRGANLFLDPVWTLPSWRLRAISD